jgi:hypothetical protein
MMNVQKNAESMLSAHTKKPGKPKEKRKDKHNQMSLVRTVKNQGMQNQTAIQKVAEKKGRDHLKGEKTKQRNQIQQ